LSYITSGKRFNCVTSYTKWEAGQKYTLLEAKKRHEKELVMVEGHQFLKDKSCWHCTVASLRWFLYIQEHEVWPLLAIVNCSFMHRRNSFIRIYYPENWEEYWENGNFDEVFRQTNCWYCRILQLRATLYRRNIK